MYARGESQVGVLAAVERSRGGWTTCPRVVYVDGETLRRLNPTALPLQRRARTHSSPSSSWCQVVAHVFGKWVGD